MPWPSRAGALMTKLGRNEKIYPVVKIAMVVESLRDEGVSSREALAGIHISEMQLASPLVRVSANQVMECYRNAIRLSPNPHFAYHAGLRFHVSTYGMYGFAILSSTNFRQTMQFAVKYHQLATPTTEISFHADTDRGVWTLIPVPHPWVDAALYKFLVELQFGILVSLHRDVMGSAFVPQELHITHAPPVDAQLYPEIFGCRVLFSQSEN